MSLIKKPIITEKYNKLNEQSIYAFVVDKKANKVQIKQEIESKYGVTVKSVNTMNIAPTRRTRFTKSGVVSSMKSGYKKAIIYLNEGDFIDYYEDL